MQKFELNNQVKLPALGLGVFRITDAVQCEQTVVDAINAGYRWIDTATAYGNEEAVGRGIARAGVPRDQLFISTKLWIPDTTYDGAKTAFELSLEKLGLAYVDLFVIHQPYNDIYGAWRAMTELQREGRIKAIGVDNFSQGQLTDFVEFNDVVPAVNFMEVHPYFQRVEDVKTMAELHIQLIAWSPLGAGQLGVLQDPKLQAIATLHHKSTAQVVLRWLHQRQIAVVAKSVKLGRIKENADIFDFELTANDMKTIGSLERGTSASLAGDRSKYSVLKPFLDFVAKH